MKQKILPILLPALCILLGFALGSTLTKLTQEPKTTETPPPKTTEGTEPKQTAQKTEETQYETYTVLPGDTLLGISLKFDVPMDELLKLNGISDANQLKAGQVLKIPKPGTTTPEAKIELDLEKMKEIQTLVLNGEQPWRLDPVEVTKATAPASYEFTATDNYELKSKDAVLGEATVEVKKTRDSKIQTFEVNLIQPVTKGEKGIWAIKEIKES